MKEKYLEGEYLKEEYLKAKYLDGEYLEEEYLDREYQKEEYLEGEYLMYGTCGDCHDVRSCGEEEWQERSIKQISPPPS